MSKFYSGIDLDNRDVLQKARIKKRTGTVVSSATPTINTDLVDFYSITALAAAITSFTTNLSGTPNEGDQLIIAITDDGTARALSFGASFEASAVALPTTTVISTRLDILFRWNSVTSKWRCIYYTTSSAAGDVTLNGVQTLTNKRITKRATTETSSATPTINTDSSDYHLVSALAANITSFTANLTGTPNAGDKLTIAIKDNATARTIAWGASFEDGAFRLPETTIVSTLLIVNFEWNADTSKWSCVSRSGATKVATIGDGSTQNPVLTHNLGTKYFTYSVYKTSDNKAVDVELERTSLTTATFNITGTPLTSGELTVVLKAL